MTEVSSGYRHLPFDVRDGRAMVSLGALSAKKYCSYSCPFCYVHGDFASYASLPVHEIVDWLQRNSGAYDIVYVSGDTDSFAVPRTDSGLELLEAIAALGTDILFTTRYVFSATQLTTLANITERVRQHGRLVFGCVSIAQITVPHLEPRPIPPPHARLLQLRKFGDIGIVPVLAMRPFLPVVPNSDYREILYLAAQQGTKTVLGGAWFADIAGKIERGVFGEQPIPEGIAFRRGQMDFDENHSVWKVYDDVQTTAYVQGECDRLGLSLFLRSRPMIEAVRSKSSASGLSQTAKLARDRK